MSKHTWNERVITISKAQQKKGRSGEIELAKLLNSYGFETRPGRTLSFGSEPDIIGLNGIHIEVKRVERLNVSEAMKQAVRDSEKFNDGIPVLFHRKNREGWLVTLKLTDFIHLYNKELNEQKKED